MSQSSQRRRASPLSAAQRKQADPIIAPHVRRFDVWLKEATLLGALRLARANDKAEQERSSRRLSELRQEIETSYASFRTETRGIAHVSRIIDLDNAYARLVSMVGNSDDQPSS